MNYLITAVHLEDGELIKIKACKTSPDFSMLFPPEEFTRKEMINHIRQKDIFFKRERSGKETPIRLKYTVNLEIDQFDDVKRF